MDIQKVVKNLFDRANSTHSQNEAEQCILKAHELMAKYGIEAAATEEEFEYSEELCIHPGNRKFRRNLAGIISTNFKCKHYLLNHQIVMFGRKNDARAAKEVFEFAYRFAYRETNRICRDLRNNDMDTTGIMNSYALGFLKGLREKLEAQSVALMVVTPPDVNAEYEELGKKRKFKNSRTRLSTSRGALSVYDRGVADGRSVINSRRLESAG